MQGSFPWGGDGSGSNESDGEQWGVAAKASLAYSPPAVQPVPNRAGVRAPCSCWC